MLYTADSIRTQTADPQLPSLQRRRNLNSGVFAAEMELGHSHFVTQRPSDPGIQRPGDPVDPVTLFYNELQTSTYV